MEGNILHTLKDIAILIKESKLKSEDVAGSFNVNTKMYIQNLCLH